MSDLPVDEKDAPEGYYAVKDKRLTCAGCAISGCVNASEEVYKVPERAYIVADTMLAEREKSLKEGKNE